jgi:hypothetical protein
MIDEATLKLEDLNAERTCRLLYVETSLTKSIVGKRGLLVSLLGTDNKVTLFKRIIQNNDYCKPPSLYARLFRQHVFTKKDAETTLFVRASARQTAQSLLWPSLQ